MKKLAIVLFVALLAFGVAPLRQTAAAGKVVRITLIDENGSGEDGSAQLTDQGDNTTKVELLMLNAPEGAVQPAHIHKGSCANLDPNPAYPLNNITDGKSTTVVNVSLTELTSEKYAINVHKSAAEISVYVSCGNLPVGTGSSSGPMTLDQAMATLIDQATELAGTIKKHEADASKNAYDLYHATFAANEDAIKAKSAATQAKLEDAMHEVRDAVNAGNWDKAGEAADGLLTVLNTAKATVTGGTTSAPATSMAAAMKDLQAAANDLVRETTNKDATGAQAAYSDFHTQFAAHEADLRAKAPNETAELEAAQTEVQEALQAGDWAKASKAAGEIQKSVNDAAGTMGLTAGTLPSSGQGTLPAIWILLAGVAFALLTTGGLLRRKSTR
jgi:hypothetical protein